jgi:hypothetical protein
VRLIATDELFERLDKLGIRPAPGEDAEPAHFWPTFDNPSNEERFWKQPLEVHDQLTLLTAILDGLGSFGDCWLVKRIWTWSDPGIEGSDFYPTIGVPVGYDGGVELPREDRATLLLILLAQMGFPSNVAADLWLIPDHGRQVVFVDHEGAVFVVFADRAEIAGFVRRMEQAGFPLPTSPPDESFYWPHWMGPKPEGWGEW